jgi:epoxyqueuosine reductase QueG
VALGNAGGPEHRPVLERLARGEDELVAEHAAWALARLDERTSGISPDGVPA